MSDTKMTAEQRMLRAIQYCSWGLVVLMAAVALPLYGLVAAQSVLLGGVLINGSFLLLKGDIEQLLNRVDAADEGKSVKRIEKVRFIFKFYARLIVVGLLLAVLANKVELNMVAVACGLGTVMVSVFGVVLGRGKQFYRQHLNGA
jgi:hypothetical protein